MTLAPIINLVQSVCIQSMDFSRLFNPSGYRMLLNEFSGLPQKALVYRYSPFVIGADQSVHACQLAIILDVRPHEWIRRNDLVKLLILFVEAVKFLTLFFIAEMVQYGFNRLVAAFAVRNGQIFSLGLCHHFCKAFQ